jgi:hypothetical protein
MPEDSTTPVNPYRQGLAHDSTNTSPLDMLDLAEDSARTPPAYLYRQRSIEMLVPDSPGPPKPYRRRSIETSGDSTSPVKPLRRRSIGSTAPAKPSRWRSTEMPRDSTNPVKPYRQQSVLDLADDSTTPVIPCRRGSIALPEDSTESTLPCSLTTTEVQELSDKRDDLYFL